MKWFRELQFKYGQKAITNISIALCVCYAAGWVIQLMAPDIYSNYLTLSIPQILRGQVWRLVTWLIYPPSTGRIFGPFLIVTYWFIGRQLEMVWGSYDFDWFIIQGVIFHIIGALVICFIFGGGTGIQPALTPVSFSLSILLVFALSFPDAQFALYGIIPIKAKYLAVFYAVMTVIDFFSGVAGVKAGIIVSLVNALVFLAISGRIPYLTGIFRKR